MGAKNKYLGWLTRYNSRPGGITYVPSRKDRPKMTTTLPKTTSPPETCAESTFTDADRISGLNSQIDHMAHVIGRILPFIYFDDREEVLEAVAQAEEALAAAGFRVTIAKK